MILCAAGLGRHILFVWSFSHYRALMTAWTLAFAFSGLQWLLSWRDRPWTVTREQRARLDRMKVIANLPVYNEDPALVDRAMWAMMHQTRPLNRIEVVDDGSTVGYEHLRQHWEGVWPTAPRSAGSGSGTAARSTPRPTPSRPTRTRTSSPRSTPTPRWRATRSRRRSSRSRDRSAQSVAGIELAFNSGVNWLTRTVSARSLFFQLVACGAQSAVGDILVNRGAFAMYRAT